VAADPAGVGYWHTQPTLLAMMATAVSRMPMVSQCWAQVCAASGGTETTPDVPTGAMHAVSDSAASTNENSLYALGLRMAAHYTRGSACEHMALRADDVSLLWFGRMRSLTPPVRCAPASRRAR